MRSLRRFAPLCILLAFPFLVRLPAVFLGLSADPIWFSAGLTVEAMPRIAHGLPGFLDFNAGWTTQALGTQAAHQWLAGTVPWWDPYSGVGLPLAAAIQSSALFLPYVLLLAAPHGALLLVIALQVTGGLAMHGLLRSLGMGTVAAVAGGVLFELSSTFAWSGPVSALPVAFLPLLLLGLERARAAALAGGPGGYRLIAVALAWSLYAGFPETAYLDGLLALAWAGYRLASLGRPYRLGYAGRVAGGGAIGMLLALPLLWPFFQLMGVSSLGGREDIATGLLSMPPAGLPLFLLPYLFGLPADLSAIEPSGLLTEIWNRSGGYLGATLALAALLGLTCCGRRELGLRVLLGAWIAVTLAKSMGVPGITWAVNLIPLLHEVAFARYSGGGWLTAAIVLAAFALDDRLRVPVRSWQSWTAAGAILVVGLVALLPAWPLIDGLTRLTERYQPYLWGSLAWGAASVLLAAAAFSWPGRRGGRAAACVLVADAAVLFMVALLSGERRPQLDTAAIRFLQANIGLHRFATLGPFQPNYGGMFGVASVNHNYLPVPVVWTDHVRGHLAARAFPTYFTGSFPLDEPGQPSNAEELAANLRDYAALGVRYILAPAGSNPFSPAITTPHSGSGAEALALLPGGRLSGTIPGAQVRRGEVTQVGVGIGTYGGQSTGTLAVQACAASRCSAGQVRLESAVDGGSLGVLLDEMLPVEAGQAIDYVLTHSEGSAVAVWLWPAPGTTVEIAGSRRENVTPHLVIQYRAPSPTPMRVYEDRLMTIYEVEAPAPYFEVIGGGCRLDVRGRERVTATCERVSSLVRRELHFPGWRAVVNGEAAPLRKEEPLFQAVRLETGASDVRFIYEPPAYRLTLAVFLLGLIALLLPRWGRAGIARFTRRISGRP